MKKYIKTLAIILISSILLVLAQIISEPYGEAMPLVDKATTQEVQMILSHHGYRLKIDGIFGQKTDKAVRHWQRSNKLTVDGVPGPVTMKSLRNSIKQETKWLLDTSIPLTETKPLTPPVRQGQGLNSLPFAPEGIDSCAEMVFYMQQAGLPDRFGDSGRHQRWTHSDGIGWRESKCTNTAISSIGCCVGYWQNYISSHLSRQSQYRDRIINECQVNGRSDILGDDPLQKQKQACVTKVVYDISGLSPWG